MDTDILLSPLDEQKTVQERRRKKKNRIFLIVFVVLLVILLIIGIVLLATWKTVLKYQPTLEETIVAANLEKRFFEKFFCFF